MCAHVRILDATSKFSGIGLLPTTPFTPDIDGGIFAAWDRVKALVDDLTGPFRGIWDILHAKRKVCMNLTVAKKCWSFRLKDILHGASYLLSKFDFLLDIFMIPFQPVVDMVSSLFERAFLSLLGGLTPDFIGKDAIPFDTEGVLQATDVPVLSSVRALMQQNPEEEILKEAQQRLDGCLLLNTGVQHSGDPIDSLRCAQGSRVAWPVQCDRFCQECEDCERWWMKPQEGAFLCFLHRRRDAYTLVQGATAGMKRDKLCLAQKSCANLWEEGPVQQCVGEQMGVTGLTSENQCREVCCHDLHCNLWQWHSQRAICQMGRSRDCSGEGGWTGGRKKRTAAEAFSTMCENADRARANPADPDPGLQPALELTSSSCFEKTCALQGVQIPECMTDAEAFLEQEQERHDTHCISIPKWEVGAWRPCSTSLCGQAGTQARQVSCSEPEKPERCEVNEPMPMTSRPCLGDQCFWRTSDWTECDAQACGSIGRRTREVYCAGTTLERAPAYLCQNHDPPATDRACSRICNGSVDDADPCHARRAQALPRFLLVGHEEARDADVAVPGDSAFFVVAPKRHLTADAGAEAQLSYQECADLATKLAVCQLQQFSAVPPDAGGTAGLVLQNSLCQNQLLDDINSTVHENNRLLKDMDKRLSQGFQDIQNDLSDLRSNLTSVVQAVGDQVTAEVSQQIQQQTNVLLAEFRLLQAAHLNAVRCNSDRLLAEVVSRLEDMEERLAASIGDLKTEMQAGFSELQAQMEDMGDRILAELVETSEVVISTIGSQINASEARLKTFLTSALSTALDAATQNLTQEILLSEARLAEHVELHIVNAVNQLEASNADQTAEILDSLEILKAGLESRLASVSDAVSGVLREQSLNDALRTERLLELSGSVAVDIASASAALDHRAAERSEHLEAVLASAISSSTSVQQDTLKALQIEVQRGNSQAISATQETVLALSNELRERFQGVEQAMSGFDRLSELVSLEMSEVNSRLDAQHESIQQLQDDMNIVLRQIDLQMQGIQVVEDRVASLLVNVSQLARTVQSGQQKLSEMLSATNRKMDKVLSHIRRQSRDLRNFHIQDMLSQFDESSVLIDGAFLDFSYELLPRATGGVRKVSNALRQYTSCRAYWSDVVGSLRSKDGDQAVARNRLREIWGTVRDRFVIATGILTKGNLLRTLAAKQGLMFCRAQWSVFCVLNSTLLCQLQLGAGRYAAEQHGTEPGINFETVSFTVDQAKLSELQFGSSCADELKALGCSSSVLQAELPPPHSLSSGPLIGRPFPQGPRRNLTCCASSLSGRQVAHKDKRKVHVNSS